MPRGVSNPNRMPPTSTANSSFLNTGLSPVRYGRRHIVHSAPPCFRTPGRRIGNPALVDPGTRHVEGHRSTPKNDFFNTVIHTYLGTLPRHTAERKGHLFADQREACFTKLNAT